MNEFNAPANGTSEAGYAHAASQKASLDDDVLAAIEVELDAILPRNVVTLENAITRLTPAIARLRAKGLTVTECADELTRRLSVFGLTVSGRTLSRLLPSKKTVKAKRK